MSKKTRILIFIALLISVISFTTIAASPAPLTVSFIDVGQADSILVQTPNNHTMLIDAGNVADGPTVTNYLHSHKVARVDVLVATHPHEDHIGGIPDVLRTFPVTQIYMSDAMATTLIFEETLETIKAKGLKYKTSKAGVVINLDPALKAEMLAPIGEDYDDLNDYSAVIKLTYGKTSFLLTGDATRVSEREMLRAGCNLKVDVLKVGHHGSNTSTTGNFLKAVSPVYAVISVGANNEYGHPGKYTLNRLKKAGIKVFRTDLNGTIQAVSDGAKITFKTERAI